MRLSLLVAAVWTVAACTAAGAEEQGRLNVPPEGFTALFNGEDLTGWKVSGNNAEHWRVEQGVLHYDGKGNSLPTEKEYADFILQVDWKIAKGGDSGIYLRGRPQVQIWDIDSHKEGSGGLWNNRKAGKNPLVPADNPVGQWNTFKIKMVGERVTVHLNGKLVVDNVPLETLNGRKTGPILLQHHGNPLWFRNIFIKELPAAETGK